MQVLYLGGDLKHYGERWRKWDRERRQSNEMETCGQLGSDSGSLRDWREHVLELMVPLRAEEAGYLSSNSHL